MASAELNLERSLYVGNALGAILYGNAHVFVSFSFCLFNDLN